MAINKFESDHFLDENQRPAGGHAHGVGFMIGWQNGPLGRAGTEERIEPNGAFVETVLASVVDRIEFYESAGFSCEENKRAIASIREALAHLDSRTNRRIESNVEGTHEGS